jgi:hypothetical protein
MEYIPVSPSYREPGVDSPRCPGSYPSYNEAQQVVKDM